MKILYLLAVFVLFSACEDKKSVKNSIRLSFEKNKAYRIQNESKIIYTQKVLDEFSTQVMTQNYDITFKVIDFSNEIYTLDMRYTKFESGLENETDTLFVSSDDDLPKDHFIRQLMDFHFQLKIAPNGIIRDFTGVDAFNKMIVGQLKDLSIQEKNQVEQQLNASFGKESVMGNLQMFFAFYPKGKIEDNKTWESNVTFSSLFPLKFNNKYELIFENQKSYGIEGKSNQKIDPDTKIDFDGVPTKLDVTGEIYTKAIVRKTDGWVEKYDSEQWVEGYVLNYIKEQNVYARFPIRMKITLKKKGHKYHSSPTAKFLFL